MFCIMPAEVAQLAKQVTADAKLEGSNPVPGNTKGGSITVLLTSCLTGLESAV